MTSTQWQRLRDLFDKALALPSAQRPAFLDESCLDDPELRQELELLLAAGSVEDNPLSRPLPEVDTALLPRLQQALVVEPTARFHTGLTLKNRYRVHRHLGDGGFGQVYLAQDMELDNRQVVVKFLPSAQVKASWHGKRFRQELQALAKLDHPGIVSVYDTGETDSGVPYLVMQFIPGETLRALLERGPVPFDRMRKFAAQMAESLAVAHIAGVSHRDLKPENIMIRQSGQEEPRAVLLDFGLARLAEGESTGGRRSSVLAGTPAYMAPEQLLGAPVEASDQYSLGVVVLEALTGKRLHEVIGGEGPASAVARAFGERQDVPAPARAALIRALAFSPAERFASVREFATAFGESEPVRSRQPWLWLVAAAVLLIGFLATIAWRVPQDTRIAFSITDAAGGTPPTNALFHKGDRIRLRFAPSASGHFYLFNGSQTAQTMRLLSPGQGSDNGAIAADQIVEFPSKPGEFLEFDEQKGEEEIWVVWSARPLPDLEAMRRFSQAPLGGEIRDPIALEKLRGLLRSMPAGVPKPVERGPGGAFRTSGDLLIGRVVLRHE